MIEPFFRFRREHDFGLSILVVKNFQIVPRKLAAESSAQRFCNRFLRGKPSCKVGNWIFEFVAIVLLSMGEKAVQEVESMPLDALSHAGDFDDVVAKA